MQSKPPYFAIFVIKMFETFVRKYPFFRIIPAILCMAVIFKLSSMTNEDLQDFPHIWDKLAHFVEYGGLAGCYCLWWGRNLWLKKPWLRVLVVVILTVAYGCTDEFHQSFTEGRDSSALDLVADAVGGLIGATIYALVCRLLNKYNPLPDPEIIRDDVDET